MKPFNILIASLYRNIQERFDDTEKSYLTQIAAKFCLFVPINIWIIVISAMLKKWFHVLKDDISSSEISIYVWSVPLLFLISIFTWNVDKVHAYATDPYNYTSTEMGRNIYLLSIIIGFIMMMVVL